MRVRSHHLQHCMSRRKKTGFALTLTPSGLWGGGGRWARGSAKSDAKSRWQLASHRTTVAVGQLWGCGTHHPQEMKCMRPNTISTFGEAFKWSKESNFIVYFVRLPRCHYLYLHRQISVLTSPTKRWGLVGESIINQSINIRIGEVRTVENTNSCPITEVNQQWAREHWVLLSHLHFCSFPLGESILSSLGVIRKGAPSAYSAVSITRIWKSFFLRGT